MKKWTLILFIYLFVVLSACAANEEADRGVVDKDQFINTYNFYNRLPDSLRNQDFFNDSTNLGDFVERNKYVSESYVKLTDSFAYTMELLNSFRSVISVVVLEDQIELGREYNNHNFIYVVSKEQDLYTLEITNDESKQHLVIKSLGDDYYQGAYEYEGDALDFNIDGNTLYLDYFDGDINSQSILEVIQDGQYLKVKLNYQDQDEEYTLTSVSNQTLSAILYDDDHLGNKTQQLVVNDQDGYILYESIYNDVNQIAGFHLHALNNYTSINKVDANTFIVDTKPFDVRDGEANLKEISSTYLNSSKSIENKYVIMLGMSSVLDEFDQIIAMRDPFKAEQYDEIVLITNELQDFLDESN